MEYPLIQKYLEKKIGDGCSPGTIDAYEHQLLRLARFLSTSGREPVEATFADLEAFSGIHLHREGIAPRSRRVAIAAIRGFYTWMADRKVIPDNPAAELPYPAVGRKLPPFLTREHAERLIMAPNLDTFQGARDSAIISLLLGCGLRVSGLAALNESNIQIDTVDGKEGAFLRVIEKGGNERLVPLPDEALLMIRAYLGHPDLAGIDRTLPNGDRVLFISLRNTRVGPSEYFGEARRLSTSGVRRLLARHGAQVGIPREFCHPHALRHSYGAELAEAGIDLQTRQVLMGHQSASSTAIYSHLSTRALKRAVDKGNPLAKIQTPTSDLTYLLMRS